MNKNFENLACDTCIHQEVCKKRDQYVDLCKAVFNAKYSLPVAQIDNQFELVRNVDFITLFPPCCNYYMDVPSIALPRCNCDDE